MPSDDILSLLAQRLFSPGDPEAQGAAANSQAMEPAVTQHFQGVGRSCIACCWAAQSSRPCAYGKWRRGAQVVISHDEDGVRQANDPIEFLKTSAIAGWLLDLEILREFDERAAGYDGYVKITDDAVEYGWLDQHDGLHRKRG